MKKTMVFLLRLILLPAALLLRMVSWILLAGIHLSSILVGPFLILLVLLTFFCLVQKEYLNVVLLAGIAGAILTVYFAAGYFAGAAESISDRMQL